jgi:phage major head subunit gpT-like protein
MLITETNLDAIRVGFDSAFMDGFMDADDSPIYTAKLAQVRSSNTATTRFGFQARVPKLREWLGDRQFNNLAEYVYSLTAKNYEDSIEVLREAILEDNLGIFTDSLNKLGRQARKHTDDLIVSLLQNGQTSLCYDGQYFFDTDHPAVKGASGSQVNYSASGMPLTRANVAAVRATMMSYTGDDGRPLGVRPNMLIVPPALEDTTDQKLPQLRGAAKPRAPDAGKSGPARDQMDSKPDGVLACAALSHQVDRRLAAARWPEHPEHPPHLV